MTTELTVKLGDRTAIVRTCLNAEDNARARAPHADGVIDLAVLLDPARPSNFSERDRRWLVKAGLRALGLPVPLRIEPTIAPSPQLAALSASAPAAAGGAFAERRAERAPPPSSAQLPPRPNLHAHVAALAVPRG